MALEQEEEPSPALLSGELQSLGLSEQELQILHACVCPVSIEHCHDLYHHAHRQHGLRGSALYPGDDRQNSCLCPYLCLCPRYGRENSRAYIRKKQQFVNLTFGFGNSEMSYSTSYYHNWNLGKKNKFFIGTGVRFTASNAKNKNYTSAPSNLAGEATKMDTAFGANTSIYALNALLNLGYNISPKLQIGFNIDLIGISFGPEKTYQFQGSGLQNNTKASPTPLNLLFIGINDKGTLNSELYLQYKVKEKLGIKIGYQHLFTEITTTSKIQTLPEPNDRFRKISDLFNVGVSFFILEGSRYQIKAKNG